MQQFHHAVRRLLPFLYERNWYTGTFELSTKRSLMFLLSICVCVGLVLLVWWFSQPIEYIQEY
jgi:hypothetical protein